MNYERFVATLNHHIFQLEREKLLRKLVNEPERFLGLFRPSKPKGKLFQHLLQAREIGFGDALEEIVAGWLEHYGYQRLDNRIRVNGETMECDHYALSPNQDFGLLIEQKFVMIMTLPKPEDSGATTSPPRCVPFATSMTVNSLPSPILLIQSSAKTTTSMSEKPNNFAKNWGCPASMYGMARNFLRSCLLQTQTIRTRCLLG